MSDIQPVARPMLPRRQFLALSLVALVSATLPAAYLLWSARQDALHTAQITALNYARTLQVRLDAAFRRADSILQELAQQTPPEALAPQAQAQHAARLNGMLDSNLRRFDELMALRIIDARGDQRYVTAAESTPGANYADRSYYRVYRRDPSAGLLFSEVVMGRVGQRQSMVISRPLRDAQGNFYGAVLAPIDLGFFQEQFKKLDIGRNGAVFLRRSDNGLMVLRWPQIDAEVNKPMPETHPIYVAVKAGKRESVNEYLAFTDGLRRISGTVVVKDYPFFLSVGLSQDDVLAPWRRLAVLTSLAGAALLALMGLLMWRLWRSDRERHWLQAQLRESQRIESIGTLAGGIAHDFNNILAAILGNVALAREDLAPGHPAHSNLEQIRKASTRARDLVQQILAFGRRQPQALVSQPLQPLVDESLSLLRSTLPASVSLHSRRADADLHIRADATQIQQVLMNLCTNAWHALQGKAGTIVVGLEPLSAEAASSVDANPPPPRPCAHLWVQDDGCGMDGDTLERIFEPFFTTKPTGQGTGLGLSVVHGIVGAHSGSIRVDSSPGHGSTVHLYFPLSEPHATAAAAPTASVPAATPPATGQHVLCVDDDEAILAMVEQLLSRCGYRVTALSDGRQAVQAVRAQQAAFDLVITDYNMPGFTGLDVAHALAAIEPELPVVISSGYVSDELCQQASAAGVRTVLHKQNTLEELAPLVRRILAA